MSITAKDYDNLAKKYALYDDDVRGVVDFWEASGEDFDYKTLTELTSIITQKRQLDYVRKERSEFTQMQLKRSARTISSNRLPHKINLSNLLNGSFSVKVLVCGEWLEYAI